MSQSSESPTTAGPASVETIASARPAVSLRSLLVGLAGVVLLCAYVPFNDFVLKNTYFVGGSLPLAVVLFMFLFALLVNGPLSRYAPRLALQTNELTVVLVMLLVCCVLPSSGLMQFWQPSLAGSWHHSSERPERLEALLTRLELPDWYWPKFSPESDTIAKKTGDDVIRFFYDKPPAGTDLGTYRRLIVDSWLGPLLGWGVFFAGVFACLIGVSFVVRRQWVENERISFPIAQVQLALIEAPEPGRVFNSTFRTRVFWIGLIAVVAVRTFIGMRSYFPKTFPEITLGYSFYTLLADPPWAYMDGLGAQDLYLWLAAMMFFVPTRISFSLWFVFVLYQIPLMLVNSMGVGSEYLTPSQRRSMNLGSLLAFAAMILWTGRHHYWAVIRQMFFVSRPGDDQGLFIRNRTAGWMALGGFAVAVAWCVYLMMTLPAALLMVGGIVGTWVVMANVVAHSGLAAAYTLSGPREWFVNLYQNAGGMRTPATYNVSHVAAHWHVQTIGGMWAYARDQLLVYGTHGLKLATENAPRAGARLLLAIVLALGVGYVVSHFSTLACYYGFQSTQDKTQETPINEEVLNGQPKWTINFVHDTVHEKGVTLQGRAKEDPWHRWWLGGGLVGTGLLAFLQLRFTWWPVHPIGLLMVFSFSMKRVVFSLFVGWLVKVLLVRFGGASLFYKARPFFLGIIIGEALAATGFALLAVILWLLGIPYETVHFVPRTQF